MKAILKHYSIEISEGEYSIMLEVSESRVRILNIHGYKEFTFEIPRNMDTERMKKWRIVSKLIGKATQVVDEIETGKFKFELK